MAAKIKKGDRVIVLAGKDKGKTGTVLRVIPTETRAVVQGINLIRRHTKQTQTQDGGILTREASIHLSNIALVDPNSGDKPKPTRVGFKINDDGTKVRIARASGATIDG